LSQNIQFTEKLAFEGHIVKKYYHGTSAKLSQNIRRTITEHPRNYHGTSAISSRNIRQFCIFVLGLYSNNSRLQTFSNIPL